MMDVENFLQSQICNADEAGLFWRSLPENTQAYKHEMSTPGREINKERIYALLYANVDGQHRLKPIIVGKLHCPRGVNDRTF
jgi:hypothetical protein